MGAPKLEEPRLISIETLEKVSGALRILAHPLRLRLVELLERGEVPVNQLAAWTDMAPSAVSQHLSMMKAHGLVSSRRDGRRVFYRVTGPEALVVIACIREHHT